MGHDAQGRELSDEDVRGILAETRPPEPRGRQHEGARSTGTLRTRTIAAPPTGKIDGALVDEGGATTPNQVVPEPAVAVAEVNEVAKDGGGVQLSAEPAGENADVEPEPGYYDDELVEDLQTEADRRGLTVRGTGANGNVVKSDLVDALKADDADRQSA